MVRASVAQLSAFCDVPHESGSEATRIAESRTAVYENQRIDVFQQARTNQGTSQERGRNTAWENAWYELERSLCQSEGGGVAQVNPWSVSGAAI